MVWTRAPVLLTAAALNISIVLVSTACSGPTAAQLAADESLARPDSQPAALEVDADWDDLTGAVDLAASESEVAIVSVSGDRADARWFEASSGQRMRWAFVSVRGDEGWIEATRAEAGPGVPIRLTCRVDDPPKPAAEAALLARVAGRLRALRGERAAAIGEPFGVPAK